MISCRSAAAAAGFGWPDAGRAVAAASSGTGHLAHLLLQDARELHIDDRHRAPTRYRATRRDVAFACPRCPRAAACGRAAAASNRATWLHDQHASCARCEAGVAPDGRVTKKMRDGLDVRDGHGKNAPNWLAPNSLSSRSSTDARRTWRDCCAKGAELARSGQRLLPSFSASMFLK